MASDQQLKTKSYYQTYMKDQVGKQPLQVLGEKYMEERQREVFDLSDIRFAQGEVYYLNKDYEAAIFKWENISYESDLYPWARKNIADAHIQLEFLAIAEDYYKEIETNSPILQMEILLRLFVLYIRRDKLQEAEDTIQKAVELDPDYDDVTKKARAFYERQENYQKGMDLAVKEAIRTKSLSWFHVIKTYVEKRFIFEKDPSYFLPSLEILYSLDHDEFEKLVILLWNYYRESDNYFSWLHVWNEMFIDMEGKDRYEWKELPTLFQTTYMELTNGNYVMEQISELIPKLITNGFHITKGEDKRFFSSIIIVWDEKFPFQIDRIIVEKAKDYLFNSKPIHSHLKDTVTLFDAMTNWAKMKEVEMDHRLVEKIKSQLDFDNYHVLVGGEHAFFSKTWLDYESTSLLPITKLDNRMIQCKIPVRIEESGNIQMMDPPELIDLKLADLILFVIHHNEDLEKAVHLKEELPDMNMYILLNEDTIRNNENITSKVKMYFPSEFVMIYSENGSNPKTVIETLLRSIEKDIDIKQVRTTKLLSSIKDFIPFLLDKRKELENNLLEKIERNEEIAEKLYQAIRQLHDLQTEKIEVMKKNYQLIMIELRANMLKNIPEILRDCSNLVTVESDFENIHVSLNEEMNERMVKFVEENIYSQFRQAFSEWIIESERQLQDSSTSLDEISTSFNYMYGEERMNFHYDFQVLDDWKRDADRMSRGSVLFEKVNILMRSASSQFLVKGAGKLFGTIPVKNRNGFYKKYQQFIESKDYSDIAKSVSDRVMQQYEFFEISIERDLEMFFMNAFDILQELIQETEKKMEEDKQVLYEMTTKPEIFEDPITLFELKVAQLEQLTITKESIS